MKPTPARWGKHHNSMGSYCGLYKVELTCGCQYVCECEAVGWKVVRFLHSCTQ
jgi:hypothetical protein